MICFLTSSPVIPGTNDLNPSNGFTDELKRVIPSGARALFVCSDPDGHVLTDRFAGEVERSFREAGFRFGAFQVLDGRNASEAAALVGNDDVIILAGGHVPTQNRFFNAIGLQTLMAGFGGVVIGISAGSMNSADVVYARPEREGEARDRTLPRFLRGLGLTKLMLLPHFDPSSDEMLDGLPVTDGIVRPDSMGRVFYAIPDGSYLLVENGRATLRGAVWRVRDGVIEQITDVGGVTLIDE